MVAKIERRIVKAEVLPATGAGAQPAVVEAEAATMQELHERVARPELLEGSTYKIKTPLSPHALYVTINDIVLNPGTVHEMRRPFEIFINSKSMEHFQWIVALTRIISAVFRKGGDVTFLVDEMRSVFDPKGGYFKKGGKYMPSLVAEIGDVIEMHLRQIGLLPGAPSTTAATPADDAGIPESADFCAVCHAKAVVSLDNCLTCLNCGDSKCG
jgi:hypothetical protein